MHNYPQIFQAQTPHCQEKIIPLLERLDRLDRLDGISDSDAREALSCRGSTYAYCVRDAPCTPVPI